MSTRKINPVVWFEIYVDDLARASKFYSEVLQIPVTAMENPTEDKTMEMAFFGREEDMSEDNIGATGALVRMDGVKSGGGSSIVYFNSDDCSVEESRILAAGGEVHKSKMSIGEYGFMVLAVDTEGNYFGVHSMK